MVGCMSRDGDKNEYDYPEYLTAEYCYNNYSPMSLNYICSYTYENAAEGVYKESPCRRYFHAIPGVDTNDFLLGVEETNLLIFWSYCTAYLYKANDNDIEPLIDWKIDYIELCSHKAKTAMLYNSTYNECRAKISSFGSNVYAENISKIYDIAIMGQFVECINDQSKYISAIPEDFSSLQERGELVRIEGEESSYLLSVRIHFKDTDMIMWSSDIILYDDHYYLKDYYDINASGNYIPLTEELEEIISSTIESLGASSDETQ